MRWLFYPVASALVLSALAARARVQLFELFANTSEDSFVQFSVEISKPAVAAGAFLGIAWFFPRRRFLPFSPKELRTLRLVALSAVAVACLAMALAPLGALREAQYREYQSGGQSRLSVEEADAFFRDPRTGTLTDGYADWSDTVHLDEAYRGERAAAACRIKIRAGRGVLHLVVGSPSPIPETCDDLVAKHKTFIDDALEAGELRVSSVQPLMLRPVEHATTEYDLMVWARVQEDVGFNTVVAVAWPPEARGIRFDPATLKLVIALCVLVLSLPERAVLTMTGLFGAWAMRIAVVLSIISSLFMIYAATGDATRILSAFILLE